ncbi:NAD(P)/FAD-dependent oxidoreductase [Arthrobacter ruber]|uniref:NAD(P)/FAD-dependent oxidoreductase n=1 Tax=Arthrobacter ruber TaxID=1258893 RepID=UPI000CF4C398|nr:NAD(P)/FAD-dependent oxidoreductase [Arthrobacter ruber]
MVNTTERRIVVVGASLGGLRAAEQLRAAGWDGEIEVIGDEPYAPYNRPPLSKELLANPGLSADEALAKVAFRRKKQTEDVTFRLGSAVVSSNLQERVLRLADGTQVTFDGLVIASGLRARRLTAPGPMGGRHVIRTLDDSLALHSELKPGTQVVVIGAGFIGCEAAATALELGCDVTLVEGGKGPMHRPLGSDVAEAFRRRLVRRGITCLADRHVEKFEACDTDSTRVGAVVLASGERLPTEVVIEAVGSVPNVEWLEGNDLNLTDGVLCDEWLRPVGTSNVVAVGDIARFPDLRLRQTPRRIEHWATPGDTAKTAARTLTADLAGASLPDPCDALPNFWSDQFGLRISGLGSPALADELAVMEGTLDDIDAGIAVGYWRDSVLVGVVVAGLPAQRLLQYRTQLTAAAV